MIIEGAIKPNNDELTNYEEATMSPDSDKWLEAIVGVKTGGSRVGGPELCV